MSGKRTRPKRKKKNKQTDTWGAGRRVHPEALKVRDRMEAREQAREA